uniref:Uncharacterized protein n=1 Tax=Cryptomonas curvata TaxID=233186 RepID=A0A7S0MVI1_9CRYP
MRGAQCVSLPVNCLVTNTLEVPTLAETAMRRKEKSWHVQRGWGEEVFPSEGTNREESNQTQMLAQMARRFHWLPVWPGPRLHRQDSGPCTLSRQMSRSEEDRVCPETGYAERNPSTALILVAAAGPGPGPGCFEQGWQGRGVAGVAGRQKVATPAGSRGAAKKSGSLFY